MSLGDNISDTYVKINTSIWRILKVWPSAEPPGQRQVVFFNVSDQAPTYTEQKKKGILNLVLNYVFFL